MTISKTYKSFLALALLGGVLLVSNPAVASDRYRISVSYNDGHYGYRVAYKSRDHRYYGPGYYRHGYYGHRPYAGHRHGYRHGYRHAHRWWKAKRHWRRHHRWAYKHRRWHRRHGGYNRHYRRRVRTVYYD